jgi:hypothetical protein
VHITCRKKYHRFAWEIMLGSCAFVVGVLQYTNARPSNTHTHTHTHTHPSTHTQTSINARLKVKKNKKWSRPHHSGLFKMFFGGKGWNQDRAAHFSLFFFLFFFMEVFGLSILSHTFSWRLDFTPDKPIQAFLVCVFLRALMNLWCEYIFSFNQTKSEI